MGYQRDKCRVRRNFNELDDNLLFWRYRGVNLYFLEIKGKITNGNNREGFLISIGEGF